MRWHRPLILTSDVFNSSVGDPAIGFVGSGGAPCALYMRGEMSLEDVQSGKEGYGMQGRHTTPESFGVQALQSASHEIWIYHHCSAVHSLTALAFVSSMSEPLRIKTCCSSVGVHHTAATSSNDHSGMMLPSLHAESHGLARFVMVRLSWHNKHRHVAQRVGSTYEASHPTERRCSSGKDKEAVPENGFKRWRMNNVPVTSD